MPGGDAVRAWESLLNIRFVLAVVAVGAGASAGVVHADSRGETLVVTANRLASRADELLADVTVIDRAQIESAGASTLVELLGRQPGMQFTQNGGLGKSASLLVRGASSGHVLVLLDGVRTGSATLGEPNLADLPLEQIERIEILRGPASALYGSDALGGVIQVFTRKGGREGAHPYLNLGYGSDALRRAEAGVSGGAGRWGYQLGVAQVETNGFNASSRAAADPDADGYRRTSASGRLTFSPAAGHEVGAGFTYAKARSWIDAAFGSVPDPYSDNEVSTIEVHTKNQLTERWHSTLRYGRSYDNANTFDSATPSHFRTVNDQFSWQNDLRFAAGTLMLAAEHLKQAVQSTDAYTQDSRIQRSILAGWNGQYGAHNVQLNLRHDQNTAFDDKTTGFVAYGYQLTGQLRASASYGTSYVAPTFNDLYWPHQDWFYWVFDGNPDLKPEEGRNREFALTWDDGTTSLSATYYLNKVRNLIDWQSQTVGAVTYYQPQNVAGARLEGLTLAAATTVWGMQASASVDFLRAEDEETGKRLQRRAARVANLRIEAPIGRSALGAEAIFSDGRYSSSEERDWLPGYGLLNLFGRMPLGKDLTLEARLDNVFDQDYTLVKDYNTAGFAAYVGLRYAP